MKKSISILIASLATLPLAHAAPVHVWHTVCTKSGEWHARLASINEDAFFVNDEGRALTVFAVAKDQPYKFGFGFLPGADFDIAYTLTLTEKTTTAFTSKACVFVITASGPAKPDIRAISYNGALCLTSGRDFTVG